MQPSMQNEFSVFRKTMETMMGKLQQPRFSTPQPPKSAVSERVSDYGQQSVFGSVREDRQIGQLTSKSFTKEDASMIS